MSETVDRIEQLTQEVRRDLEARHGTFATLSPEFDRRVDEEVKRRMNIPPFPDAWRCRACRWWERCDPGHWPVRGQSGEWGECGLVDREGEASEAVPVQAFTTESFACRADFGCIQWEPKE